MGARIVLVARDHARGQVALARVRACSPRDAHRIHFADLSRLAEMKRVGTEIASAESRIDVLINNAGALFSSRQVTDDGLERTFATNHVAYFVLTHYLRERLIASAPARVVNTASDAHTGATLDFDDLQSAKGYRGFQVYSRSKLCNILYTRELARRLAGTGVTANCLHPATYMPTKMVLAARGSSVSTIEEGVQATTHLITAPELDQFTGRYFNGLREARAESQAYDRQARQLARMFADNFATYADGVGPAIRAAGPRAD